MRRCRITNDGKQFTTSSVLAGELNVSEQWLSGNGCNNGDTGVVIAGGAGVAIQTSVKPKIALRKGQLGERKPLVLSLLRFKPAPVYILDEIDAALDLSHTQNIGQMLRTHFAHSQFIVVSLKSGLFQNANVIFRTKFVDGGSTVSHYRVELAQILGDSALSERDCSSPHGA